MNDCVNAEIRDQLPELLHERLDAGARARVLSHVDACADCRAELDLLRNARDLMVARTPRVDFASVVQALPKPPAQVTRLAPRRRVWADWRVAAAVTLLVAGGTSVAVLDRGQSVVPGATAVTASQPQTAAPSTVASAPLARDRAAADSVPGTATSAPLAATEARVASADEAPAAEPPATTDAGAHLGDLNEQQLQSLLKDIDKLQPVPVTEPDPVTLRVTTTSSSEGV